MLGCAADLATSLQAAKDHSQSLQLQLDSAQELTAALQIRLDAMSEAKQAIEGDCLSLNAQVETLQQQLSSIKHNMAVYQSRELELQVCMTYVLPNGRHDLA